MGKLEHGGYEVLILMEYCGGNKQTSLWRPYNLDDYRDASLPLASSSMPSQEKTLYLVACLDSSQLT